MIFLMSFLEKFEANKNSIYARENNPFKRGNKSIERYYAPCRPKIRTNEATLQSKSSHFQASEKPKTVNLIKVFYK